MAKVNAENLPLAGAKLVSCFEFGDERGRFVKVADGELIAMLGFHARELFYSVSKKHCIRGLHYMLPAAQSRLVFCTQGSIYDVILDIRKSSPTFGKWHAEELSENAPRALYIPPGFAHGFLALGEMNTVVYLADSPHQPESDKGILFSDPLLGIKWPLGSSQPIVSKKDLALPALGNAQVYD